MEELTKTQITNQILETVAELAPDATSRTMYGGTVIEMRGGNPKSRIGGVFSYANYVSLEFTKGVFLEDLNQVLEGSGKMRRHVKLHCLEDLHTKDCRLLLKQAITNSELI